MGVDLKRLTRREGTAAGEFFCFLVAEATENKLAYSLTSLLVGERNLKRARADNIFSLLAAKQALLLHIWLGAVGFPTTEKKSSKQHTFST